MGFFRCLRAERIKLKRAPVWIAFLVLPAVAAAMGTFNYLQNLGILTQQWYSLWSQHTLFSSNFFLPALIAVYCAYLCRLEHFGHNWNAALTAPAGVSSLYFAKLAAAACMAALTQLVTGALFILWESSPESRPLSRRSS